MLPSLFRSSVRANTSTDVVCAPDRIQLVSPLQLILWTLAGGAFRGGAEHCRRSLQPVHAEDVPESQSKTDQLVCQAVISCGFAQLIDLSDDWIHSPVIHIDTMLRLPVIVLVGAS